jgi:hypothetical protein
MEWQWQSPIVNRQSLGKVKMTETERIRDQLRRAFEGDAWHGPGVLELLGERNREPGRRHPIAGAHSIWELVVHIQAWRVPADAGCKATARRAS